MDEAIELANYLPISFKTVSEQEYIKFLWESFETNYESEKYQFAFLAYHMLTMSFIYFKIWQIKQIKSVDFQKAMIGFHKDLENELINATSPFTFCRVNESIVMRFLKLIGCDNGKVGSYASLVKERNDTAHANGNIFFSTQNALDRKINEVLRIVNEIQSHSKSIIEHCYKEFLLSNINPAESEYIEPADQIQEVLIHRNYLSQEDLKICLSFDMKSLSENPAIVNIRTIHKEFNRIWSRLFTEP